MPLQTEPGTRLDLLLCVYRQLLMLDELGQTPDISLNLKTMTEAIGILHSLNQTMNVAENRRDEVELLLQQVVPLVGRINLLERTMNADEELRQLHANVQPRFNSLVQETRSLHDMFSESIGWIVARERASIENISEEDGFKREAKRWE